MLRKMLALFFVGSFLLQTGPARAAWNDLLSWKCSLFCPKPTHAAVPVSDLEEESNQTLLARAWRTAQNNPGKTAITGGVIVLGIGGLGYGMYCWGYHQGLAAAAAVTYESLGTTASTILDKTTQTLSSTWEWTTTPATPTASSTEDSEKVFLKAWVEDLTGKLKAMTARRDAAVNFLRSIPQRFTELTDQQKRWFDASLIKQGFYDIPGKLSTLYPSNCIASWKANLAKTSWQDLAGVPQQLIQCFKSLG